MGRLTEWMVIGILLPTLAAAAPGAPGAPTPAKRMRIAVMEIRPLGTEPHKAELLSEVALTEAAATDKFEIIGRSDINSMIGFDQQKKILGCTDDSNCLAEIGGALGVEYVMIGTLGKLGALYRVDMKLVDARKARVAGRFGESVEGSEEKLVATVQRGVRKLLGSLQPEPTPVAVAAVEPAAVAKPVAPPPDLSAAKPAAPAGKAGEATSKDAGMSRRAWGWTVGGTGVAVLGVGALFGLQARAALDAEKRASADGDQATYLKKKDETKQKAMLADVCFVAGGVAAGIGTWLLLTGSPAVAVAPTEGGLLATWSGRF
jgi:TolB-like protein